MSVRVCAIACALILAAPASALAAQPKWFRGLAQDVPTGTQPRAHPSSAGRLHYFGGSVLHSNRTHVIFWQPSGSGMQFEPGYVPLIERFLSQVARASHEPTNVYGLSGQYTDAAGPAAYDSRYGGAVLATDPLPPSNCSEPPSTGPGWATCLTDDQLEAEIATVIRADHLPTRATDIYFLVTPNGLGDCLDAGSSSCALGGPPNGYCGYHSQTAQGVLYAVIPYNAVPNHCQSDNPRPNGSAADPTISTLSHEHNEIITDPEADAWSDGSGQEDGDLCITNFGPRLGGSGPKAWNEDIAGGHYYLQEEWSNEDGGCRPRDEADRIWFRAPRRVPAGKRVAFTGHARDPDGAILGYTWFFADGSLGHRRTLAHAFKRPGTYRVVLRTTDSAGNWAYYARVIRVSRPPRKH